MSCTVIGIPWTIAWLIGAAISPLLNDEGLMIEENHDEVLSNNDNLNTTCDETYVISEKQFLEKSFETPFMDKELLLKTLEEHGVTNINENAYGQIRGISGNFSLNFERLEADKPYSVLIKYLSTDDVEDEIQNLNNEYAVNVQEAAYMDIVANLKNQNMEIESEEVCDDNTIVLTINLE